MVQEGQLFSFGRATYGRIGRLDVDPKGDDCYPEARPVDSMEGVIVKGMAAGEVLSSRIPALMPCLYCQRLYACGGSHCGTLAGACSLASIDII